MDQMIMSGHPGTCGCHLCGLYGERQRTVAAMHKLLAEEIKLLLKRRELQSRIEGLTETILEKAKRPEPV